MIGGALAADPHVFVGLSAGGNSRGKKLLDRGIALIELLGHHPGVAVQAQRELREVIGADGEAVKVGQKFIGQQGIGWELAHHDDSQPFLATLESRRGEELGHLPRLGQRAHERYHDLDIVEPHILAHPSQCLALELEAGPERLRDIARSAPEADHRILFLRLIDLSANEAGVFIGLEIRHANDDRLGMEGCGDGCDALGQPGDIELDGIFISGHMLADGLLQGRVLLVQLQQGSGMDTDHAVDDELKARQTDPMIGQHGEIKGTVGIADVHHNLERDLGHGPQLCRGDLEVQLVSINVAGIALGARYRDLHTLGDGFGGIAATDHRRNAELAGNDGGMTGASAAIGDDRGSPLHDRFPIGIGHVGDQHIAVLHPAHFLDIGDDPGRAGADSLADAAPADQHLAALLEAVALQALVPIVALDGFGTRLKDEKLTALAILAPLDVHRPAIVFLDNHGLAGEILDLGIGEAEAQPLGFADVDDACGPAVLAFVAIDHLDGLIADNPAKHRRATGQQGRLVDVELIGVHRTLHHAFAEAVSRGDEDHLIEAGLGVNGEHDAGGAPVTADHLLDAGGECHLAVIEALVHPIGDRAVVEQRGEHLSDGEQHIVQPLDIQEGLLLPGKGGVRQVFGGCRGAYRHG